MSVWAVGRRAVGISKAAVGSNARPSRPHVNVAPSGSSSTPRRATLRASRGSCRRRSRRGRWAGGDRMTSGRQEGQVETRRGQEGQAGTRGAGGDKCASGQLGIVGHRRGRWGRWAEQNRWDIGGRWGWAGTGVADRTTTAARDMGGAHWNGSPRVCSVRVTPGELTCPEHTRS